MWNYWICLYTETHCTARGLRAKTIQAYRAALEQFRAYVQVRLDEVLPREITARQVLEYLEYLRKERNNGDAAINRHVTILKNFYRAIVALGHLEPAENPLAHFPPIRPGARKLPVVLSPAEVQRLLESPPTNTVLGWRDRAILRLLYGTGIRASECAELTEENVDLDEMTIRVAGKGGHERTIPLNAEVAVALRVYRVQRGAVPPRAAFFRSRLGSAMSRGAIYERVRTWAQRARIPKRVSPHRLRHTCATHLVKAGTPLVVIRDLLGHRQITSTQLYLHVTAEDLRCAADTHPIRKLAASLEHLLPKVKLPLQPPPGRRRSSSA